MSLDLSDLRATPADLRKRYFDRGWWNDDTLGRNIVEWLSRSPASEMRIWSRARPQRIGFGGLAVLIRQFAAGIERRGIVPGDTVAVYVPNSIEGAVAFAGVMLAGATAVPVAPYYGLKELKYIVERSQARLLITTESDPAGRLEQIVAAWPDLPLLEDIYVVDDAVPGAMRRFDELIVDAPSELSPVDPERAAVIAFTSGTTTGPKGVVHLHRSICYDVRAHMVQMPDARRPTLTAGPIAHAAGMLAGLCLPAIRGKSIHLTDGWDPVRILAAMRDADLSTGGGTPFFLNSLLGHPDTRPEDIAKVEMVGFGAAAIPWSFAEKCEAAGIRNFRLYGSTEHPTVTMSSFDDPAIKRHRTDGRPLEGVEVRLVGSDGRDVDTGEPGELWSRGPDLCVGYTDPALNGEYFTSDGWFRTGDVAVKDEDGFYTITDRIKDIIIRNGLKIGAVEVEDALLAIPGMAECAVIAVPDDRTGERAHAVIRVADGASPPTLAGIRDHLKTIGLAKQKWPESLECVDDFPRTPLGKIKKFELRRRMTDMRGTE